MLSFKRLVFCLLWFVVFFVAISVVVGLSIGVWASIANPETAGVVGQQLGHEVSRKFGGLFLLGSIAASLGLTFAQILPGTKAQKPAFIGR